MARAGTTKKKKSQSSSEFNRLKKELKRVTEQLESRDRELAEATEQQTATSEVLNVIARSPVELQPVYQAILTNTTRLCEANIAALFLFDGELLHTAASFGTTPEFAAHLEQSRPRPSHETTTRLAALERRTVHVADLLSDRDFVPNPRELYEKENVRTVLSVPMLREDKLVGVITTWRREVRPFSDKQVALIKTFADQAVIAIENARLFNDLKESLEQQTATSEILGVIASSPTDLQSVFDKILANAARLCDAKAGTLFLHEDGTFKAVALCGATSAWAEWVRNPIRPGPDTGLAHLVRELKPIHVADILAELTDPQSQPNRVAAIVGGARTGLHVPMLKERTLIGAINIYRHEVRPFTDNQIKLLETFAAQAVIAIENVRLFKEIQERNAELREALEHQTATSEVLGIISRSPTDVQPVLDAIVESAGKVCGIDDVVLRLREGSAMIPRAHFGPIPLGSIQGSVLMSYSIAGFRSTALSISLTSTHKTNSRR